MVDVTFRPLANIRGRDGKPGEKGDTGTLDWADAKVVPAGSPAAVRMKTDSRGTGAEFDVPRGLPGMNAIQNDEAIATYVEALDSDTRAALERSFTPKGVFFVNVADVGAVLDGVADDTSAIQAAIDAHHAGSGILKLSAPPGSVIRTDGWRVEAKDVIFDFRDCHIITSTTAPILDARGEWGPTQADVLASGGQLLMPDTSRFAVGDIVKVFSDDQIRDARPGNDSAYARQGEFTVVAEVRSGTELRVVPSLYDSYSANVRVAKIIPHHVEFHFGTAEPVSGAPATGGQAMFRFNSLVQPSLTGKCLSNNAAFSGFTSCYMAHADVDVAELPPGNGYGVMSTASVGGSYTIRANKVRHAYSDDCSRHALGASQWPGDFGRPMYDTIRGMSFSTSESSWNTHHGGIGHKFIGVIGSGVQNAADGAVFALRGRYHELHACSAHAAQWGIRIYDEGQTQYDTWARSDNHHIVGFTGRGLWNGLTVVKTNYISADEGFDVWLEGGVFETRGGLPLRVERGRVSFGGRPVFNHIGSAPPSGNLLASTTVSELRGKIALAARAMSTGKLSRLISFSNSSPSFQQIDLEVDVALSPFAAENTDYLVEAGSAIGRIDFVLNTPTTASKVSGSVQPVGAFSYTLRTSGVNGGVESSSALLRPNLSGSEVAISTARAADPVVSVMLYNTTARTISSITAGAFSGQVLALINYASSTANVTVAASALSVPMPAAKTIAPGQSAWFVWDGSANTWRQA